MSLAQLVAVPLHAPLLVKPWPTPQQRESLESLDNLLSELRQGLIKDGGVRIAATQLESARDLDRKLMAELQD